MKFDHFSYYSDNFLPEFISEKGRGEINTVFYPETEETFKVAFSKLKKRYFKKVAYVVAKENITKYCDCCKFDPATIKYCLDMFKIRAEYFQLENKNNKSEN